MAEAVRCRAQTWWQWFTEEASAGPDQARQLGSYSAARPRGHSSVRLGSVDFGLRCALHGWESFNRTQSLHRQSAETGRQIEGHQ